MSDTGAFPLVKLANVVEVLDHQRVPVNADERQERQGDVPYYGANGQQGWIDRPLFNEPLILLAEDGGNFDDFAHRPIAYRISGPSWVNNHAHVIKAIAQDLYSFIFWSLVHKDIRRYIAGGTRTKLTQGELREIEIPWPSRDEGGLVGRILDTLDTQIRRTEALIAKLEQIKQGLLTDLLTRGIDDNGQLRPPPEQAPHLYKDSPLGRIPREWDVRRLRECIELVSGQHIPSDLCNDAGRGVRYLTGPADFREGVAVARSFTEVPQVMCEAGDLLMTVKGSGCGKVAIASHSACISRQLMALRFRSGEEGFWQQYFLQRQEQFQAEAEGGAIPGLSRAQILEVQAAAPRASGEMVAIGARAEAIRSRVQREHRQLGKLQAAKAGLMDDLLTGRVRVTPLLDKTAAVAG